MILRDLIRFLFLCVFFLFPCFAQEAESVVVRFVSFPRVGESEPLELLVGEAKTIEVAIPSNEISAPYKVKRPSVWVVGKTVEGEDGKSKFEVYGKGKALASSKQLLLLIRKGRKNGDGFKIIALDSRDAQFGSEKFLFMNATQTEIAGVVGAAKFSVKPGRHTIVKPKVARKKQKELCRVSFAYKREDKWKPFSSTIWPFSANVRTLTFFYHDPRTKHLRLHSIRDFLD